MPQNEGWTAVDESTAGWTPVETEAKPKAKPAPTLADRAKELMSPLISTGAGLGLGAAKGLGSTTAGISQLLSQIPGVGQTLAPTSGVQAFHQMVQPKGLAEKVGFAGEQIGEFMVPAGLEEKGAKLGAELLPKAGRLVGRMATEAATTGAIEKLHGGSATTGAVAGAAGGAAGIAMEKLSPALASAAMRISKKELKFGAEPGLAVLEKTKAIRPEAISRETQLVQRQLTSQLEKAATRETKAGTEANIQPTLDVIGNWKTEAINRHDKQLLNRLTKLEKNLKTDLATGKPMAYYSPKDILDIKRGVGDSIGKWTQDNPQLWTSIRERIYSALDKELDRTVPESAKLNPEIHSLLVARDAARKLTSRELAGTPIRLSPWEMYRFFLLSAGGAYGYRQGGPARAAEYLGAVLGLTTPTAQMGIARAMQGPLEQFMKGSVLEAIRGLDTTKSADQQPTQ